MSPVSVSLFNKIEILLPPSNTHQVAYRARTSRDILSGIDEFLHQAVVLPPGSWNATTRIDPPANVPTRDQRMAVVMAAAKGKEPHDDNNNNDLKNGAAGAR